MFPLGANLWEDLQAAAGAISHANEMTIRKIWLLV